MTKNNKITQYYYNGLGQCFSKNSVIYMYDLEGHLIGEYTSAGVLIQETVWLNDLPIATIRPNGTGISVYFIHSDELGTPRVVTDTTNKPVWRSDGDAFQNGDAVKWVVNDSGALVVGFGRSSAVMVSLSILFLLRMSLAWSLGRHESVMSS